MSKWNKSPLYINIRKTIRDKQYTKRPLWSETYAKFIVDCTLIADYI